MNLYTNTSIIDIKKKAHDLNFKYQAQQQKYEEVGYHIFLRT